MKIDNNLKEKIDTFFQREIDKNSVTSEDLIQNGINPNDLIGEEEIKLAIDMMEEEEWLKKLIYDSIIAKAANNSELHNSLNHEIVEYCDLTENEVLLNKYIDLLVKYI
jgi:hypothetical protein